MSFHVRTGPGNAVQTPTGSSLALAVEVPHARSLGWLVYVILSAKHARLLMVDLGAVLQAVEVSSCTTAEAEATWVQAASVYVVNVTLVAVGAGVGGAGVTGAGVTGAGVTGAGVTGAGVTDGVAEFPKTASSTMFLPELEPLASKHGHHKS